MAIEKKEKIEEGPGVAQKEAPFSQFIWVKIKIKTCAEGFL